MASRSRPTPLKTEDIARIRKALARALKLYDSALTADGAGGTPSHELLKMCATAPSHPPALGSG